MATRAKTALVPGLVCLISGLSCTDENLAGGQAIVVEISTFQAYVGAASCQDRHCTITSGPDSAGRTVQGAVRLSWRTSSAQAIQLLADGQPVDLSACLPGGERFDCVDAGSYLATPESSTRYSFVALRGGGDCGQPGQCDIEEATVDVRPPAVVVLEAADEVVVEGDSTTVSYRLEHVAAWQVGLVELAGTSRELEPCQPAQGGQPPARCVTSEVFGHEQYGLQTVVGEALLSNLTEGVTLGVTAVNDAQDTLGDLGPGDAEVQVAVVDAPRVTAFSAGDSTTRPGDVVTLTWMVDDSVEVRIGATPATAVDEQELALCVEVDGRGEGACEVRVQLNAELGELVFTLVAAGPSGATSSPRTAVVELGEAPSLELDALPTSLAAPGGAVTLDWLAIGAERLTIEQGDVAIFDSDDCGGEDTGCSPEAGSLPISPVTADTVWTATATSAYGTSTARAGVQVYLPPRIDVLEIDGEAASGELLLEDDTPRTLSWETERSFGTSLERVAPGFTACAEIPSGWNPVSGFPGLGAGSFEMTGLSHTWCYRFRAHGGADQIASREFAMVRMPLIVRFEAADTTVIPGAVVDLEWETDLAESVSLSVQPVGAVTEDELMACGAEGGIDDEGAGACEVAIQAGVPAGIDVIFTLGAGGYDGVTAFEELAVGLGEPPAIEDFTATPSVIQETTDVTLEWAVDAAASGRIAGPVGVVQELTAEALESGALEISAVEDTTTWQLFVENAFGQDVAQTRTFLGASIDSLVVEAAGEADDAMDGEAQIPTGAADVSWTTSEAEHAVLESCSAAPYPSCRAGDVPEGAWSLANEGLLLPEDEFALSGFQTNQCVRLTVCAVVEAETPAQCKADEAANSASFLLKELPIIESIRVDPSPIPSDEDRTIRVEMSVAGATHLRLTAELFVEGDDGDVSTSVRQICDEESLDVGALSESPVLTTVVCNHQSFWKSCSDGTCPAEDETEANPYPADAKRIRYWLRLEDSDRDIVNSYIDVELREGTPGG